MPMPWSACQTVRSESAPVAGSTRSNTFVSVTVASVPIAPLGRRDRGQDRPPSLDSTKCGARRAGHRHGETARPTSLPETTFGIWIEPAASAGTWHAAVIATSAFDELVGAFDPPMVIVTAAAGPLRGGCLVGFHGQAGMEPVRYGIRLSKANHTYRVALFAEHLAVHAVDRRDRDLAELFGATTGDDADKFARCEWESGPSGVPLLVRCPSRMVLRTSAVIDDGSDHVGFVGVVVDTTFAGPLDPLRLPVAERINAGHAAEQRPVPFDVTARPD